MLRRTQAGPFALEQAISLDKLNAFGQGAAQSEIFLPLEAGLVDIPALNLSPEAAGAIRQGRVWTGVRSEEHTSELQSLMRISYAVFCLKKKKRNNKITKTT